MQEELEQRTVSVSIQAAKLSGRVLRSAIAAVLRKMEQERTTRKVGMGIPLLMDSARQSGGDVRIESEPGKGTEVTAVFGYSNIDRPPLGDVANALMLLVSSNPALDFLFTYRYNGDEYLFDTVDVREILGDDALKDLTIIRNLEEMIKDNMREIRNC